MTLFGVKQCIDGRGSTAGLRLDDPFSKGNINNAQAGMMRLQPRSFIPYVILAALVVSTSVLQPNTVSLDWLGIKTNAILPLALATAGQTLVLLTGGIDLSVGGVISLTNSLEATRMPHTVEGMVAFTLAMLALGFIMGAFNGLIIVRIGLQPFIATLITWSIYGGLALWILPTDRGDVPQGFINVLLAHPGGIPVSLLLLVVLGLAWVYLKRAPLGKAILSLGSNAKSAHLSGVNVNRVRLLTYALSGFFAATAGVYRTAQVASGSPTAGNSFILLSVSAAVIGGTSLAGGKGSIIGSIIGVCVLKIIGDLLVFSGVSSYWAALFQGLLLILIIASVSVGELVRHRREGLL
jgi:ribose transport system permease protein